MSKTLAPSGSSRLGLTWPIGGIYGVLTVSKGGSRNRLLSRKKMICAMLAFTQVFPPFWEI